MVFFFCSGSLEANIELIRWRIRWDPIPGQSSTAIFARAVHGKDWVMLDSYGALNKLPILSENILERNPSYWKSLNCIALQELAPCLWQDVFIPVIAKHYE